MFRVELEPTTFGFRGPMVQNALRMCNQQIRQQLGREGTTTRLFHTSYNLHRFVGFCH
jgi:hypothetical protein